MSILHYMNQTITIDYRYIIDRSDIVKVAARADNVYKFYKSKGNLNEIHKRWWQNKDVFPGKD